jgi:hypothetical protein
MLKGRAAPAGGQAGAAWYFHRAGKSAVIFCFTAVLLGEEGFAKCALCSGLIYRYWAKTRCLEILNSYQKS